MPWALIAALGLAAVAAPSAAAPASPDPGEAARTMAYDRFASGREALAARRWAEAEADFGAAVRLQPRLALAYYGLGQALLGQERAAEAADAFLSCRNVFSLARRADAARAKEMEIRDLRDTLQALASRHALSGDRFLEMQLEKRLGELQRGSGPLTPWVPPGVTLALGTAYFQAGARAEAEQELLAAAREPSVAGDAENNLAVLYAAAGRGEEAEAALLRAEKAGARISPRLRDEIRRLRASASAPSSAAPPASPSASPSP
jgi:tetratricopeptide (TPR) repeat protein